jgi:hypothetical protein
MNSIPRLHTMPGTNDLGKQEAREVPQRNALRMFCIIALSAFVLGTWDLLFARIFWSSNGVHFVDVLQSIASGIYGKASHLGGTKTAIIGAICHYFIALCMVLAYFLVSRKLPALIHRPLSLGLAYGIFLYFFMNLVVVPLSAIGHTVFGNTTWMIWSIFMHGLFGVLCAVTARFAQPNV